MMRGGFFAIAARKGAASLGAALSVSLVVLLAACGGERAERSPEEEMLRKGRALYAVNCSACHHPSRPAQDGPLGPGLGGVSLEVLTSKVRHGTYPEGYSPRRDSRIMQVFPHLGDDDLRALHAFLQSL